MAFHFFLNPSARWCTLFATKRQPQIPWHTLSILFGWWVHYYRGALGPGCTLLSVFQATGYTATERNKPHPNSGPAMRGLESSWHQRAWLLQCSHPYHGCIPPQAMPRLCSFHVQSDTFFYQAAGTVCDLLIWGFIQWRLWGSGARFSATFGCLFDWTINLYIGLQTIIQYVLAGDIRANRKNKTYVEVLRARTPKSCIWSCRVQEELVMNGLSICLSAI